jgi:hypothetical protein
MKNFKKLISAVAAAAITLTSFVQVSAVTVLSGSRYQDGFYNFGDETVLPKIPAGTYDYSDYSGEGNPYFEITYNGNGLSRISPGATTSGARALYLYGGEYNSDTTPGASISFHLAEKSYNDKYVISFNVTNKHWLSAASLNKGYWDTAKPRFNESGTQWTTTDIGQGKVGTKDWIRCSATLSTVNNPQIDFAVYRGGKIIIDDITVKDQRGKVLFKEDFEITTSTEGEDELSEYTDGWYREGDTQRSFQVVDWYDITYDKGESTEHTDKTTTPGEHRLRIYGNDENTATENIGTYKIALPKKTADGVYKISYDAIIGRSDLQNTSASFGFKEDSIYYGREETGDNTGLYQIKSGHNEYTITDTNAKFLYFAAVGWANAYVDNIVVKDSSDNVIFSEDFENFDTKYTHKTYSTKLQGLSANGIDDVIYLSWRNPKRDDIETIQIYENGEETFESQLADIYYGSEQVNIVEMSDNFIGAGSVHEYDVRFTTDLGVVYHNYITAKEGERFYSASSTKDGLALQGWRLTGRDGSTYKGLGSVYYDTLNKASGNASLHINPNITRLSDDQPHSNDATHVTVQYGDDEEHDSGYHLFLDAYVDGLEDGQTYKLTLNERAHHAPAYFIYSEGFKIGDGTATSIGSISSYGDRNYDSAWRDVELEFTVNGITSSLPVIRFDFSNGCDDFWLDDVKLVKVGTTTNLIANGNFEHGLSDLAKSGNTITWTLADSNDSVNVYQKAGDSLVLKAALAKGANSYTPNIEGTKETLVFRTVKKSGNTEFVSEQFPIELTQNSYIYDAKFEVVDDNLVAIGTPANLIGDILLKTSVKVENASNSLTGADLYTLIYKNGILLNIDKQTVSTNTGEVSYSSVMKVPNVSDGTYSAKLFVWNMGDFEPLKQAKTLDE